MNYPAVLTGDLGTSEVHVPTLEKHVSAFCSSGTYLCASSVGETFVAHTSRNKESLLHVFEDSAHVQTSPMS